MSNSDHKKNKKLHKANPLEAMRSVGTSVGQSIKEDLAKPIFTDLNNQLFGGYRPLAPRSGEIGRGENASMKDMLAGEQAKNKELRQRITFERRLREEEKVYVETRTNELKVQIQTLHEEVTKLAIETPKLSKELQVAAMSAPIEPSEYEVGFLEQLIKVIKNFRVRVENASHWLAQSNARAQKKNVWGQNYKKSGAKYLLSQEHYLSRSAG